MFADARLRQAELLRAQAEDLTKKMDLMRCVVDLSQHPLWQKYCNGIDAFVVARNNTMLALLDNEPLAVVDRQRSNLAAEIRLLDFIKTSPQRFEVELEKLAAQIDEKNKQANEIEKTFGFVKKGARNG